MIQNHKEAQDATTASAVANTILPSLSQSTQVVDFNLDPSLPSKEGAAISKIVDSKASSGDSNPPTTTSSTTTPTSSLSNNPYLSLSVFANRSSGSTTSNGQPVMQMHPYPMFYSSNTSVTSNTSTYPAYSNPYYYLAGPMPAGSNRTFPPGTPFPSPVQQPPAEPPQTVKYKRLKAHTVTTKSFNIPMVPRDEKGKPMLPLNVGIMTVINLGELCMREHFHTERYIYPVGYEVSRYLCSFSHFLPF